MRAPTETITLMLLLLVSVVALAENSDVSTDREGVFVKALKYGEAQAPVPLREPVIEGITQLQKNTGDSSPVIITVKRIERFSQQPTCGRLRFHLSQPSSNVEFTIGGEINLCEDGKPPRRVCNDDANTLIPANQLCGNGTHPVDTDEVSQAMIRAEGRGEKTREQVQREIAKTHPNQDAGGVK